MPVSLLRRASFQVLGRTPLPVDLELIKRIIDSYHAQKRDALSTQNKEGRWTDLGWQGNLAPLDEALVQRNVESVRAILQSLFQTQCPYGIAMGREELDAIRSTPSAVQLYEDQWMDSLTKLAEALGVVPVANPETGLLVRQLDASDLLGCIEETLGIRLAFPQHFGVFGCEVGGLIIPRIALFHLLAASMCSQWLAGRKSNPVIEIGGGFGGLYHFLCRLADFNYVAFDVPAALAVQAVFIAAGNPQITIQLYGEKLDFNSPGRASFLPSWTLLGGDAKAPELPGIKLIINQDTLAELENRWLEPMMRSLAGQLDGPLISISPDIPVFQSGTSRLRSLLLTLQLKLFDRVPFQVRPGYMREIYLRNGIQ